MVGAALPGIAANRQAGPAISKYLLPVGLEQFH